MAEQSVVTDSFSGGAANPAPAPWTAVCGSGIRVVDPGQARNAATGNQIALYNAGTLNAAQYVKAKAASTGSYSGLACRGTVGPPHYCYMAWFGVGGSGSQVYAFTAGTFHDLGYPAGHLAHGIGDTVKMTAEGYNLKGFVKGTQVFSYTDATYFLDGTKAGLAPYSQDMDDFEAGNIVADGYPAGARRARAPYGAKGIQVI
jgi:hypothetical protein